MATLKDLIDQHGALSAEIEAARALEREEQLPRLRTMVSEYGITAEELFGKKHRRKATVHSVGNGKPRVTASGLSKNVPKYRDPASGKTWSGYGRNPNWFKSNEAKSFEIAAQ